MTDPTPQEKLKPCPFEKGTPIQRRSQYGHYIVVEAFAEEQWRTPYFGTANELLQFWNTRFAPQALIEALEALKLPYFAGGNERENAGIDKCIALVKQHFGEGV